MNPENKKYVAVSQHWSAKKGQQVDGKTVYTNPVCDEGKNKLTSLKDLQILIDFWGWGDSGIYYKFTDQDKAPWGNELYEIGEGGSLTLIHTDYDSSD